jgi:hypothetical protein
VHVKVDEFGVERLRFRHGVGSIAFRSAPLKMIGALRHCKWFVVNATMVGSLIVRLNVLAYAFL